MTDLTIVDVAKARLRDLIREHALLNGGDFVLASGAHASTCVDLRRMNMHPEGATLIGHMLVPRLAKAGITGVGGMVAWRKR